MNPSEILQLLILDLELENILKIIYHCLIYGKPFYNSLKMPEKKFRL
jgi:hypothetical protein